MLAVSLRHKNVGASALSRALNALLAKPSEAPEAADAQSPAAGDAGLSNEQLAARVWALPGAQLGPTFDRLQPARANELYARECQVDKQTLTSIAPLYKELPT